MEERKDNDDIYKKLKQAIKDDGSIELNVNSQEFQLLGKLARLTSERFLEQIEPMMTLERARFVRKLRVDDGLTWAELPKPGGKSLLRTLAEILTRISSQVWHYAKWLQNCSMRIIWNLLGTEFIKMSTLMVLESKVSVSMTTIVHVNCTS